MGCMQSLNSVDELLLSIHGHMETEKQLKEIAQAPAKKRKAMEPVLLQSGSFGVEASRNRGPRRTEAIHIRSTSSHLHSHHL
jgi:hypothetical protein